MSTVASESLKVCTRKRWGSQLTLPDEIQRQRCAAGRRSLTICCPHDLRNTDAASGQPETVCKVKLTRLDDWPAFFLKEGRTVYDQIADYEQAKGKGGSTDG